MADSTYAQLDKTQWKAMLKRRLSSDLRRALMSAYDVPTEYHAFVGYMRKLDAEIQSIRACKRPRNVPHYSLPTRVPAPLSQISKTPELTVLQGGSAMDLDTISRQKNSDGRLTEQAKDARRKLGHCVRCNKPGHFVRNCPLSLQTTAIASAELDMKQESEELKDQFQRYVARWSQYR